SHLGWRPQLGQVPSSGPRSVVGSVTRGAWPRRPSGSEPRARSRALVLPGIDAELLYERARQPSTPGEVADGRKPLQPPLRETRGLRGPLSSLVRVPLGTEDDRRDALPEIAREFRPD